MRRMFSEKQIKKLALDGLVGQDVKVKTIEQSQPNLTIEFTPAPSASALGKGVTFEAVYNRCLVVNGFLYIIMINKFKNETENPITLNYQDNISGGIRLPSAIADKIIDFKGKKVSGNDSFATISLGYRGGILSGTASFYELAGILSNTDTNDVMSMTTQSNSNVPIPAGSEAVYEDRLFLSLF